MKRLLWTIPAILLMTCYGCNQSDVETGIQDGAEAATVAAVVVLDSTLPAAAPVIIAGLRKVSDTAVSMLQFPADMFTLEQLINLDMASGDPNITKYRAIVNFVLPVLNKIPGVSTAMNTPLNALSEDVLKDVRAFFEGIQLGLGQPAGITLNDFLCQNPRIAKRLAKAKRNGRYADSDFDVQALINALKSASSKPEKKSEAPQKWPASNACIGGNCAIRAEVVKPEPKYSCKNGYCWRIVGTNDYVAKDGTVVHGE